MPSGAPGGGQIWVGLYGGGLARFGEGRWTRFGAEAGLPSPFVTDLARSAERPGTLWVATDGGGLARLEGELNWIRTQPAGVRQEPDAPGRPAPETEDDTPVPPEPGGPPSSAPVYGPEDDDPDDAYSGGRAV